MIKLKKTVSYVETFTITGKKIIIGDKSADSFTQINKKEHNLFLELIDILNNNEFEKIEELPDKYHTLAYGLKKKGYFDDEVKSVKSFNEYRSLSKIIYQKKIKSDNSKENTNIIKNIFYYMTFVVLSISVILFLDMEKLVIDTDNISITEILISAILIPIFVISLHELGHYLLAKYTGISASSICVCFVIIYPSVYLSYRGINLCKTINKLMIMSGGVFAHLLGILIGIAVLNCGKSTLFVQLWILSNISMIYANILPMSASDGYFMLSSIIGIYNIRMKGYRALNSLFHKKKVNKIDIAHGIILVTLWAFSFYGLYSFFEVLVIIFDIEDILINLLYVCLSAILIIRFIYKIYQMKF